MCETTIVLMKDKQIATLRSTDKLVLPTIHSADYGSKTLENTPNGFSNKMDVMSRKIGLDEKVSCFARLEDVEDLCATKDIVNRAVWVDVEPLLKEAIGLTPKTSTVTRTNLDVIRLHSVDIMAVVGDNDDDNYVPTFQMEEVAQRI